jgi:hypothetical protein
MKATLKTLLTAMMSVALLSAGASAFADGRPDGWRASGRYEQQWNGPRHDYGRRDFGRYEYWRHHDYRRHVYGGPVFLYGPPAVYTDRFIYGPPVYRNPPGASVIIDLPPIILR